MREYLNCIKVVLFLAYIYFILTQTVIGRAVYNEPIFKGLFWEIHEGYWKDIFLNILLFIPLGFLFENWKGIIFAFLLSFSIEAIQYFGRLGFCEVDDLVNNTVGAAIGFAIRTLVIFAFSRIRHNRYLKKEK